MRPTPDVAAARRRLAAARAAGAAHPDPPAGSWSADRRAIDDVLQADQQPPEVLAALTLVTELRADLDRAERQLIAIARERGAGWRAVAAALGLGSRQAAEQRWLRLRAAETRDRTRDPGAVRRRAMRQRKIDATVGTEVAALRREATRLHDRLGRRPDRRDPPDPRDPHRAAIRLAERTLSAIEDASPGALYDLARHAVDDLQRVPDGFLGRPVAQARDRVAALAQRPGPRADPT